METKRSEAKYMSKLLLKKQNLNITLVFKQTFYNRFLYIHIYAWVARVDIAS